MNKIKIRTIGTSVLAGVLAVIAFAGCSSGTPNITSKGTLIVNYDSGSTDDVQSGAQIVITDPSGTVVDTSDLTFVKTSPMGILVGNADEFTFNVDVPGNLTRYGIKLTTHGTIWFSQNEMKQGPGISLDETSSLP